jgi:two-component system sensor histidine kinase YesM
MRRKSIRSKLILLMLIATIVPTVTSMVITYSYTTESLKNRTVQENSNLTFQGKTNLINYMNIIDQNSLSVYNYSIYSLLETTDYDYRSEDEIYNMLQRLSHSLNDIYQVYLYIERNQRSTLVINDRAKRRYGPTSVRIDFPANNFSAVVQPPHPSSDYGLSQLPYYAPATVLSLHRPIYRVPSYKLLGFLSIDIKLDGIRNICSQLYENGKEELYLLDRDGTVIYASDENLIGKALNEPWSTNLSAVQDKQGSFEWNKGLQIYQKIETPYMNWMLVKRIPYTSLYANARELTGINMTVAALSMIITIAATLFISFRITSPIKQLIGYINKIQTGNLEVDINVTSSDEIGILSQRFRTMIDAINNLILREYKLDIANKTNQLKALQAQINPHFLNNALQSIGTLALQHEAPRVYALISSLGKMMRYSMATGESIVPLHKELDHVKAYLGLQMQRFEHQLTVEYDLDENTFVQPVPKMILQPIVENYFKHGFEPNQDTGGKIRIASKLEEGLLRIIVEDNGRGISEEKLHDLQCQLNAVGENGLEDSEENIGLRNVLLRLRLYFDSSAQLHLEPVAPHGVRVILDIPVAGKGENQ